MEPIVYDAFWSYAHEDNDRQGGRVLALSEALKDEYAVTTGDDLEVFVDRESLEWGDLWRERIENALGDVPFFIAIVTPKYVRSAACRKELLAFSGQAESRGIGKLLLPILFIDVAGLHEDSGDEVLAIIARTQYVNWTKLRLKKPDSSDVLEAIADLAARLQRLREEAASASKTQERRTDAENFESLTDVVDAINAKLEPWLEAVEFDHVAGRQWKATVDERMKRIQRLRKGGQPQGAVLSVYKKLGLELLPIALDRLEKAKAYSRTTVELAPLVTAALRYVRHHRELLTMLSPLADGVREAILNIEPPRGESFAYGLPKDLSYSKSLQEADRATDDSRIYISEANEIVLKWRDELAALESGTDNRDEAPPSVVAELTDSAG